MVQFGNVGIEPHIVPAEERGVGIAVVARHPLAQIAGLVGVACDADLGEAHLLDEHVRRDRDDRAGWVMGGVDQRDRGAVAVANEDRLVDAKAGEEARQHLERLFVHERRGPRPGRRVRLPVAEARERHRAPAGGGGESLRKAAPQPDRPEPLVQQHERRLVGIAWDVEELERSAGEGEIGRWHGVRSEPTDHAMQTAPGVARRRLGVRGVLFSRRRRHRHRRRHRRTRRSRGSRSRGSRCRRGSRSVEGAAVVEGARVGRWRVDRGMGWCQSGRLGWCRSGRSGWCRWGDRGGVDWGDRGGVDRCGVVSIGAGVVSIGAGAGSCLPVRGGAGVVSTGAGAGVVSVGAGAGAGVVSTGAGAGVVSTGAGAGVLSVGAGAGVLSVGAGAGVRGVGVVPARVCCRLVPARVCCRSARVRWVRARCCWRRCWCCRCCSCRCSTTGCSTPARSGCAAARSRSGSSARSAPAPRSRSGIRARRANSGSSCRLPDESHIVVPAGLV